jgi:hypothetical protein
VDIRIQNTPILRAYEMQQEPLSTFYVVSCSICHAIGNNMIAYCWLSGS